jgi:hypothetical protein
MAGEILESKGGNAGAIKQEVLKRRGINATVRRIARSGALSIEGAVALGATTVVVAGCTYFYDKYVDAG